MVTILGVTSAILLFALVALLFRSAEQGARVGSLATELNEANARNKKLQTQLQGRADKLSQTNHEASKREEKVKGQLQRIEQQQAHLNDARNKLEEAQENVRELSREVNRLRIEREQLREKVAQTASEATKASSESAGANASVETVHGEHQAASQNSKKQEGKKTVGKLERALTLAKENEERLVEKLRQMKQAVVEREHKLRKITRRAEHNHRAYIITQLQLDLVSDENYVLRHGKQPPLKSADKAVKRQINVPADEPIELLNEDGPIDLIGVGSRADEPFEPIELDIEEPFGGDEESASDVAASDADENELPARVEDDSTASEEAVSAEESATSAPEMEEPSHAESVDTGAATKDVEKSKTTRLRKGGRGKTQASAPPRPEA